MRETEGGKTRLTCEAAANPQRVDFAWTWQNASLTADAAQLGLQSVLTVDTSQGPATGGVYVCHANNSVGLSTSCQITIEGRP